MAKELVLDINLDIEKAKAKAARLNAEFEIQKRKVEEIEREYYKSFRTLEQINDEIDKLKNTEAKNATAAAQKKRSLSDQTALLKKQISEVEKQKNNLDLQRAKLKEKSIAIKQNTQNYKDETSAIQESSKALSTAATSLKKFANRIGGLVKSVLVFSVISKALQNIKEQFSLIIGRSSELSKKWAQLKGNLATIGAIFATTIEPLLTWIVDKLIYISSLIGSVFAKLLGKDINQMAKLAKKTGEVAENSEKTLASFDTLQKIDTTSNVTNENSGFDTSAITTFNPESLGLLTALQNIDLTKVGESLERLNQALEPYKGFLWDGLKFLWEEILIPLGTWTIEELLPHFIDLLTAALEALAPILDAMRPTLEWLWENIVLPLATMIGDLVINILGWITEKLEAFAEWAKEHPEEIKFISDIILSLLAGIIAAEAVKHISTLMGNITQGFKLLKDGIKALLSPTSLLAIGFAVLFYGIGLLAANWDKMTPNQRLITILGALAAALIAAALAVAVFHASWSVGIAAAAIAAGIALILGVSIFSNQNINDLSNIGESGTVPSSISEYSNLTSSNPISVPFLAKGGVIPGGSPQLVMFGDQRRGQTNIEAPEPLLRQIVREESGQQTPTLVIEATGSMSQLIKFLNLEIKKEDRRSSIKAVKV